MNTYLIYLIIRFILFILSWLPINVSLWLGKLMGTFAYYINTKQRKIGYSNLKAAFSHKMSPRDLKRILKGCYQNLGQMLIEVARFPRLTNDYIDRYIKIEGMEYAKSAESKGKGLIFLSGHFGNWELAAQIVSLKGHPMKVLARRQKHTRLNDLLNTYRSANNCQVITRGMGLKSILRSLRNNEILGMLADQDVRKNGILIDFFGRKASTPQGVIAIASKTQSAVIPCFIVRRKGPRHNWYIQKPLDIQNETTKDTTLQRALQDYHNRLMKYVEKNPEQWLWIQKRWKSTPSRSVLILNDGKAGHLNQSKAVAELLKEELRSRGLSIKSPYAENEGYKIIEVKFKNKLKPSMLAACSLFSSYACQGYTRSLKIMLDNASYKELLSNYADFIISCGSKLSIVNLVLSKENNAKSITIMKPLLKIKDFNLAIIPKHDRPKMRSNVVITDGAPNLINEKLIDEHMNFLKKRFNLTKEPKIGFFFGGDIASYGYTKLQIEKILSEIKKAIFDLKFELLMTTSRRTGSFFESLIKESLKGFDKCKLLVIASEENLPETMGGILGLSEIVVVSFDSISMISEAISSRKDIIVIVPDGYAYLKTFKKHKKFIDNLVEKGLIHTAEISNINKALKHILKTKPEVKRLNDNERISKALRLII